jgi:arginyl-tRNA synthetase
VRLGEPSERALALALLGFGDVVVQVGDLLEPHRLCGYLFDLAQAFSAFYEGCPVLNAPDEATRGSRLALSRATLDVLETGLGLLGIEAPERM